MCISVTASYAFYTRVVRARSVPVAAASRVPAAVADILTRARRETNAEIFFFTLIFFYASSAIYDGLSYGGVGSRVPQRTCRFHGFLRFLRTRENTAIKTQKFTTCRKKKTNYKHETSQIPVCAIDFSNLFLNSSMDKTSFRSVKECSRYCFRTM